MLTSQRDSLFTLRSIAKWQLYISVLYMYSCTIFIELAGIKFIITKNNMSATHLGNK